jgi:hypothetical protein
VIINDTLLIPVRWLAGSLAILPIKKEVLREAKPNTAAINNQIVCMRCIMMVVYV